MVISYSFLLLKFKLKATPRKNKWQHSFKSPTVSSSFLFHLLPSGGRRCKSSASFHTWRELNLEPHLTTQFNENHLILVKPVYSEEKQKINNNLFCLLAKRSICVHSQIHTQELDNSMPSVRQQSLLVAAWASGVPGPLFECWRCL